MPSDHQKTRAEIEADLERESASLIGHGMIKCPHCGKAVRESAQLCVNCGAMIHGDGQAKRTEIEIDVDGEYEGMRDLSKWMM